MAFKSSTEIKVGIFVILAFAALVYMTMQVGKGMFKGGDTYELTVTFDNVSGLKQGAPVEIAGIEVGTVSRISLVGNRARLTLSIREGVEIRSDAAAVIKTRGVLGDKYIEIQGGSDSSKLAGQGDHLKRTSRAADIEQVFEKVGKIADDVGLVAKSVANVFGGEKGEQDLRMTFENLRDMTVSLNELVQANMASINAIVNNMEGFSSDMRVFSADMKDITGANKRGVNVIVDNFERASAQLETTLATMNSLLGEIESGRGPLAKIVRDEQMGEDLKKTVASLESVSRKIDEGKGTLGKLVNDEKTGKELDQALEGVNKLLAKQESFKTDVDFHSELHSTGDIKSYLNIELQPSEDKYYLLGIVDDPKGRTEITDTTVRQRTGTGAWQVTEIEKEETERNKLTFNAQIAKRWGNFGLRGGLFESTGGAALDWYFWEDRAKLYFEAFDFQDDEAPHLKSGVMVHFLKNFYATAGFDDFAGNNRDRSVFGGLGLRFTDEDLKFLLTGAPTPEVN